MSVDHFELWHVTRPLDRPLTRSIGIEGDYVGGHIKDFAHGFMILVPIGKDGKPIDQGAQSGPIVISGGPPDPSDNTDRGDGAVSGSLAQSSAAVAGGRAPDKEKNGGSELIVQVRPAEHSREREVFSSAKTIDGLRGLPGVTVARVELSKTEAQAIEQAARENARAINQAQRPYDKFNENSNSVAITMQENFRRRGQLQHWPKEVIEPEDWARMPATDNDELHKILPPIPGGAVTTPDEENARRRERPMPGVTEYPVSRPPGWREPERFAPRESLWPNRKGAEPKIIVDPTGKRVAANTAEPPAQLASAGAATLAGGQGGDNFVQAAEPARALVAPRPAPVEALPQPKPRLNTLTQYPWAGIWKDGKVPSVEDLTIEDAHRLLAWMIGDANHPIHHRGHPMYKLAEEDNRTIGQVMAGKLGTGQEKRDAVDFGPAEAEAEYRRILSDPRHPAYQGAAATHRWAVRDLERLNRRRLEGKAPEGTALADVAPAARSQPQVRPVQPAANRLTPKGAAQAIIDGRPKTAATAEPDRSAAAGDISVAAFDRWRQLGSPVRRNPDAVHARDHPAAREADRILKDASHPLHKALWDANHPDKKRAIAYRDWLGRRAAGEA